MVTYTMSKRKVHRILAAVCITAGLGLAGCDPAADTNHAAQRTAREAARKVEFAGDPRPSDKMLEDVANATDIDALAANLKARAAKGGINDIKDMVVQPGVEKDLSEGIAKLQKGIALDPTPVVKSGLEAQMGGTQLLLAEQRAAVLQAKIDELGQQSEALQNAAQLAVKLLTQGDTWDKAAKAPSSADLDQAKAAEAQSQKAAADAQAKVASLQSDITGKGNAGEEDL